MKKILLFFVLTITAFGQDVDFVSKIIKNYVAKDESRRPLEIYYPNTESTFDQNIISAIKSFEKDSSYLPGRLKPVSGISEFEIVLKASGKGKYKFTEKNKYLFYITLENKAITKITKLSDIDEILYVIEKDDSDNKTGQDLDFVQLFNLSQDENEYKALKLVAFLLLRDQDIAKAPFGTKVNLEEMSPNPLFLADQQINSPHSFDKATATEEYKWIYDISFSRATLYVGSFLNFPLTFTQENHQLLGLELDKNEKLQNALPYQSTAYKVGMRLLVPGTESMDKWGIDIHPYIRFNLDHKEMKNNNFLKYLLSMENFENFSKLNGNLGFAVDMLFYSDPIYLNFYGSFSSMKFDKNYIYTYEMNPIGLRYKNAMFSFTEFAATLSFYWDIVEMHKVNFDIGAGGFDVYGNEVYDNGQVRNYKLANLAFLPIIGLDYNMLTKPKNQLLGIGARFFDGFVKFNTWLQLYRSEGDATKVRLELQFLTDRMIGKPKAWDNQGGTFIQLRLRHGF